MQGSIESIIAMFWSVDSNRRCEEVLRNLKTNPPPHTIIRLQKPWKKTLSVKYECAKGAKMVNGSTTGVRKCENGAMVGDEPKCQCK